jgi:hypothetical protein
VKEVATGDNLGVKVWTAIRIIVRDREVWIAVRLIALALLWVGLLLLRAFSTRIGGLAPSSWWFYVLLGITFIAFLVGLWWLQRRYDL